MSDETHNKTKCLRSNTTAFHLILTTTDSIHALGGWIGMTASVPLEKILPQRLENSWEGPVEGRAEEEEEEEEEEQKKK